MIKTKKNHKKITRRTTEEYSTFFVADEIKKRARLILLTEWMFNFV